MKKNVKRISITLAAIMALSLTACGGGSGSGGSASGSAGTEGTASAASTPATTSGGEVVKISFAGVTSSSAKEASELWKEIVERETGGSLEITLFPDNMLADDRVAVETTQFGDIDMATSSTSPLCTMYADFYLFDSPYLFLNKQEVYDYIDSDLGKQMLDGLEGVGLKGMMLWENGFRNFTNNKVAASSPDDVKGMKVRTMENEVHLAAWKAFGANPTPMAFAEVFTALQQGTIDAQENPLGIIDANKFQEVQKYVSQTQHVYTPYIIVMNLDKWNSLTPEQQAAMEKANKEATEFQRKRSQELEDEILTNFEAQGVTVVNLSDAEKSVFQKVIQDNNIFDIVKEKMTHPEWLDEILAR